MLVNQISAIVSIFVMLVFVVLTWGRPGKIINQWAEQNDFKLIRSKQAYFFKGPFTFSYSEGQPVYRVTVEDKNGLTRSGWLRCGTWMMGTLSDNADVRWDGE